MAVKEQIIRTDKNKPLPYGNGFQFKQYESDDMQCKREKNEYQSDPFGRFRKLLIQRLGFPLGKEGICTTSNCAGQASTLSALEKNDDTHDQARHDLQDGKNEL